MTDPKVARIETTTETTGNEQEIRIDIVMVENLFLTEKELKTLEFNTKKLINSIVEIRDMRC